MQAKLKSRRATRESSRLRALRLHACILVGSALLFGCSIGPDYERPLPIGGSALLQLEPGDSPPDLSRQFHARAEILDALENSERYLAKATSTGAFPRAGVSHARVSASVARLRQLLEESESPRELELAIREEFEFLKSAGWDGRGGGVLYTGYYTPIFSGRLERSSVYRYPLYARPADLESTSTGEVLGMRIGDHRIPYPSRRAIDGEGLLEGRGLELVWLASPMEAYLCHVQGSAFIQLGNGEQLKLGFGGTNGREYSSLANALVAKNEIPADHRGIPDLLDWALENPERLEGYLFENERYTFFTPIDGTPHGSLDVPVTAERSLATDKTLFPRAAPVVVDTRISIGVGSETRRFTEIAFDQDTGGGIRTAGRADIYMGTGAEAGAVAGRTKSQGQLYYLLLKEDFVPRYLP